jgi:hypothetical protein
VSATRQIFIGAKDIPKGLCRKNGTHILAQCSALQVASGPCISLFIVHWQSQAQMVLVLNPFQLGVVMLKVGCLNRKTSMFTSRVILNKMLQPCPHAFGMMLANQNALRQGHISLRKPPSPMPAMVHVKKEVYWTFVNILLLCFNNFTAICHNLALKTYASSILLVPAISKYFPWNKTKTYCLRTKLSVLRNFVPTLYAQKHSYYLV